MAQKRIIDISCGENHTLAVTEAREIYSWGAGQFGQLGHGDLLRQNLPNKIVTLESHKIVQVSAGKRHSVALDDKGRIFVWGCNDLCQLGLKTIGGMPLMKKRSQMFPEAKAGGGSALTTISDSTSPKEKAGADIMTSRVRPSSLSIDIMSLDSFTFSPPQWQFNARDKFAQQTSKIELVDVVMY